jgi:putative PIN family toxin of toxin-antitoxin system
MLKVIVDTNIIVSSMLTPDGPPDKLMTRLYHLEFSPFLSNPIFDEYDEVLNRPKFQFAVKKITETLNFFRIYGQFIDTDPGLAPGLSLIPFTDESDRKFYDVLCVSGADYLITGNVRHFPQDPRIVLPSVFLKTC